ncbi:hypothetical protein, partial [Marivita sp.]|uniref:hypothetical protein n=1 Tax=Marivita sp. TaxID=2003365 RepID=UPI0026267C56
PSSAQLSYAKNIAQADGIAIPDEARTTSAAMSAWIEQRRGKTGKKGRTKPRRARDNESVSARH